MINDNQLDFEIMKKYKDDARLLRKEIQINNQEIYFINIYITFYSSNLKKLIKNQTEFRIKLFSKRILSNIANFRQLQCYLANLPFNNISNNFLKSSYRNITTDALVNFFPFYNKTIFNKNGIFLDRMAQNTPEDFLAFLTHSDSDEDIDSYIDVVIGGRRICKHKKRVSVLMKWIWKKNYKMILFMMLLIFLKYLATVHGFDYFVCC